MREDLQPSEPWIAGNGKGELLCNVLDACVHPHLCLFCSKRQSTAARHSFFDGSGRFHLPSNIAFCLAVEMDHLICFARRSVSSTRSLHLLVGSLAKKSTRPWSLTFPLPLTFQGGKEEARQLQKNLKASMRRYRPDQQCVPSPVNEVITNPALCVWSLNFELRHHPLSGWAWSPVSAAYGCKTAPKNAICGATFISRCNLTSGPPID